MDITNLPGSNSSFKASTGPGSFKRKLAQESRYHAGLDEAIRQGLVEIAQKHSRQIKTGRFGRQERLSAIREIKKQNPNLQISEIRLIKSIIKGLSSSDKTESVKNPFLSKKPELSEAQKRRNIMASRQSYLLSQARSGGFASPGTSKAPNSNFFSSGFAAPTESPSIGSNPVKPTLPF